MKKSVLFLMVSTAVFVLTPALYAQGGCVNSPENPTVLLGVVGSAGGLFVWARARFRARRRP